MIGNCQVLIDDEQDVIPGNLTEAQYLVLARIDRKTHGKLCALLNGNGGPSMTVCPICRVDDFIHVQGCPMA